MAFTFVDLFAGIGGFHAALSGMGGKCVYAVENDKHAAEIYQKNWGISAFGDITQDANEKVKVPPHDVLVAGFPCQPFSKSGDQKGMNETRGTLFWNILKIVEKRKPSLILLENVRNLVGPRHQHEWKIIIKSLREQGYSVSDKPSIFSPHLLPPDLGGRPQVRERVFIAAVKNSRRKTNSDFIKPLLLNKPVLGWDPNNWDLEKHLLSVVQTKKFNKLTKLEIYWIKAWNEFVIEITNSRKQRLPGFPLWGDDWILPKNLNQKELDKLPEWKSDFLIKNSNFYKENKRFIDQWTKKWNFYTDKFPPSRRKLEWQAQDTKDLWNTVMHFRPSGIRAKRATYLPTLVAITQTSIIGKKKRRISIEEAAHLQGLPTWFSFENQKESATFKQLGNGVNVAAVWYVLKQISSTYNQILNETAPNVLKSIISAPDSPDEIINKL
jgi:DNA (cytosine-5)-methyltransferase 1